MFTDTHCHLGAHRFPGDELPGLVHRASEAGIHRLVTLATNLEDIPVNLAIADRFPNVFACVGIHPCDVQDTPDDFLVSLRDLARHPKVVALGETGLDYYHPAPDGWTDEAYHQRQRDFLTRHFELAAELKLNVVLHTRDRTGDASLRDSLAVYKPFAARTRAVFHCFPGSFAQAEPILALGGLISFTGIATFKNATMVRETATQCPAGSFMLETDAPYLAPIPHRGQRCEPAHVRHTAEAIAQARQEDPATLAQHTESTANAFYRFNT